MLDWMRGVFGGFLREMKKSHEEEEEVEIKN